MSIDINDIELYMEGKNLDIRNNGNNPRFVDQKCTPDVLSFIAGIAFGLDALDISIKDIWKNKEFEKMVSIIFGKPSPKNQSAHNEYNKFIGQNLELLAHAGILEKQKLNRAHSYSIIEKGILEYIGQSDWHAFLFLGIYFNKFFHDSGFIQTYNNFLKRQNKEKFAHLKEKFITFMQAKTNIGSRGSINNGATEIKRMFPKIINVLAVANRAKGTCRGHLSSGIMTYSELMYNRENFRDIGKEKSNTRKESIKNKKPKTDNALVTKAKNLVKKLHPNSEISDNSKGKTVHVHHIFPQSDFPSISHYKENLIALTVDQHLRKAHPNGNTVKIDLPYQNLCLLAKSKSIQDIRHVYSKESFIHIINTGFQLIDTEEKLDHRATFEEIEKFIIQYYRGNS